MSSRHGIFGFASGNSLPSVLKGTLLTLTTTSISSFKETATLLRNSPVILLAASLCVLPRNGIVPGKRSPPGSGWVHSPKGDWCVVRDVKRVLGPKNRVKSFECGKDLV